MLLKIEYRSQCVRVHERKSLNFSVHFLYFPSTVPCQMAADSGLSLVTLPNQAFLVTAWAVTNAINCPMVLKGYVKHSSEVLQPMSSLHR